MKPAKGAERENGVNEAEASFNAIAEALERKVAEIRGTGLHLTSKRLGRRVYVQGLANSLEVSWRLKYANSLSDASLDLDIYVGTPPMPGQPLHGYMGEPQRIKHKAYVFDLQPDGLGRWIRSKERPSPKERLMPKNSLTTR